MTGPEETSVSKLRVLLVDDSPTTLRIMSDAVASDPMLEVVATAPNGAAALALVLRADPDVVVLDVELPIMGGIDALRAIRQHYPGLPVIMYSNSTARGSKATVEALTLGATECIGKPTDLSD